MNSICSLCKSALQISVQMIRVPLPLETGEEEYRGALSALGGIGGKGPAPEHCAGQGGRDIVKSEWTPLPVADVTPGHTGRNQNPLQVAIHNWGPGPGDSPFKSSETMTLIFRAADVGTVRIDAGRGSWGELLWVMPQAVWQRLGCRRPVEQAEREYFRKRLNLRGPSFHFLIRRRRT